jgi:hypothetical protein
VEDGSVASALFSTRKRTVKSAAFNTVKMIAVTQANPTIGKAMPSITTAT